ncbi:hypothetical protein [Clostridium tagluense]|uniref:hypothetical protein n=1 Tax=Clostridium tagluense TaxID=360422 RepID=UPI001C6E89D8|nr:hypothetical protein [Clostridium tagluense]MBW9154850.1 hypothetical protein [Clostridium tagluense]WLC64305.1 hypothetical protein KTC93_15700 [Clostridium tagluense]
MKTTTNYGFKKPEGNESVDIADLNFNADAIDQKLKSVDSSLVDNSTYSTYKLGIDSNDIYTQVLRKRANGTLIIKSILSGGTSPTYTTKTETKYGADGATVEWSKAYALTYDADGNMINEVLI